MKRSIFWYLLLVFLVSGFGCNQMPIRKSPEKTDIKMPSSRLLAFFPQTTGTTWAYDGMAEYASQMVLKSNRIQSSPSRVTHFLEGKVADMSDGESKANFNFKLAYRFTSNSVYEEIISAGTPFPHTLKYLKILTLPLEKGQTWEQQVRIDGKNETLKAEITAIGKEQIDGRSTGTISVRYQVPMTGMPDGIYQEIRVFAEGYGVYRFEKTFGPNHTDWFNYFLRELDIPKK